MSIRRLRSAIVWRWRAMMNRINEERRLHWCSVFAAAFNVSPLAAAFWASGIGRFQTPEETGERHFLTHILPHVLKPSGTDLPLLMDVGANTGHYVRLLRTAVPHSRILAFEPNPIAFEKLRATCQNSGAECEMLALGCDSKQTSMFVPANDKTSELGSLIPAVLTEHHGYHDLAELPIKVVTLDAYCKEKRITFIDFLKLDAEGMELSILSGAQELISEGRVACIQFEFNEMNVQSRCFLKDFYRMLEPYEFFRLLPHALLELRTYSPRNEIFWFQNILAVHRDRVESVPTHERRFLNI